MRGLWGVLVGVGVLLTGCSALGIKPPSEPVPSASVDWDAPFVTSAPPSTPAPSRTYPEPTYECQTLPEDIAEKARAELADGIERLKPGKIAAVYAGANGKSKRPYSVIAARSKRGGHVVYTLWTHAEEGRGPDLFQGVGPDEGGDPVSDARRRAQLAAEACLEQT